MIKMLNLSTTIIIILIISMSAVLVPTEKVIVVFPNNPEEVIYNVYTESVTLESNFEVGLVVNISRIDTVSQEIIPEVMNVEFEKSITFNFSQSGFYQFVISSPQLVQVSFTDEDFKSPLLLIAVLLIIAKIVIWLWDANFLIINPLGL